MITIILFFSAWSVFLKDNWSTSTFVTNYLPLWLFPILGSAYLIPVTSLVLQNTLCLGQHHCNLWEALPPRSLERTSWYLAICVAQSVQMYYSARKRFINVI